jgi:hypothetical protein
MTRKWPDKWRKNNWVHHHDNVSTHAALIVHQFLSSKNVTDLALGFSTCLRCATRQCGALWLVSGRLGIPVLCISVVCTVLLLEKYLSFFAASPVDSCCSILHTKYFTDIICCSSAWTLGKNFYFLNLCYCIHLN